MGSGNTKISVDSENTIFENSKFFTSESVNELNPVGRLYGQKQQIENIDDYVEKISTRLSTFSEKYKNGETRTIEFIHPEKPDQRILLVAVKSGNDVVFVIIRTIDEMNLKKGILYTNNLEPTEEACNAPKWRTFIGFPNLLKKAVRYPVICKMVDIEWIKISMKLLFQRHYDFQWYHIPEGLQTQIHKFYKKSSV